MIDKQQQTLDVNARKALMLDLQKYFHGNYYQWAIGQLRQKLRSSSLTGVDQIAPSEYDCWTRAWLNKT